MNRMKDKKKASRLGAWEANNGEFRFRSRDWISVTVQCHTLRVGGVQRSNPTPESRRLFFDADESGNNLHNRF